MTNTQTGIIAASVILAAGIVAAALTKPWQALTPKPPLCIGAPSGVLDAQAFAEKHGCRLP